MSGSTAGTRAAELARRYGHLDGSALLRPLLTDALKGGAALVSSFGAESAVLLALVAEIDRGVPVIFLDTGKLFDETLRYRDLLTRRLGLGDVRTIVPEPSRIAGEDPDGELWRSDPDACCRLRKVSPLDDALRPFVAWINGRKRYHGAIRAWLPAIESDGARVKINPLVRWSKADIEAEFARRDLPRHPLEAEGYISLGCVPCTARVAPDAERSQARWPGREKTECGIHVSLRASALAANGVAPARPGSSPSNG